MAQSNIHHELALLAFSHTQDGSGTLYARAADLVRDADRIASNPKLKQVNCLGFDGEYHIAKPDPSKRLSLDVVCGAQADLHKRVIPAHQVPTCEACIAVEFGGNPEALR